MGGFGLGIVVAVALLAVVTGCFLTGLLILAFFNVPTFDEPLLAVPTGAIFYATAGTLGFLWGC